MTDIARAIAEEKRLRDLGTPIEGAFSSLIVCAFPDGLPEDQKSDLRSFFFAGAFALLTVIESCAGGTPTRELVLAVEEIKAFSKKMMKEVDR